MPWHALDDLGAPRVPPPPARRLASPSGSRDERRCRWCERPLSALQRVRGDVCGAMDCRRRATDLQLATERAAAVEIARTRAAAEDGAAGLAGAPVVWLRHHDVRWVRPAADALARQRAYLLALAAAAAGPDLPEPASPDDDVVDGDPAGPTAGNHLCALCEGRCCWAGGRNDAFLRAEHLRRWLARHVGASWADAVDRYMGLVPERHVENSCLHHGARGCTLPREMRSRICNEYSCASLQQVDGLARKNAGVTVIAGIVRAHAVHAVAAVSASGIRPLPGAAPDVAAPNPA